MYILIQCLDTSQASFVAFYLISLFSYCGYQLLLGEGFHFYSINTNNSGVENLFILQNSQTPSQNKFKQLFCLVWFGNQSWLETWKSTSSSMEINHTFGNFGKLSDRCVVQKQRLTKGSILFVNSLGKPLCYDNANRRMVFIII